MVAIDNTRAGICKPFWIPPDIPLWDLSCTRRINDHVDMVGILLSSSHIPYLYTLTPFWRRQ